MEKFNQIQSLLETFKTDFQKFYEKENNAAGVRVRKHMQQLRKLAQDIRDDVQSKKNVE